ncbi:MAG: RNA polymerase sigma factor [Sandaracinaceae bacterium]
MTTTDLPEPTDEQLMAAYLEGDAGAHRALFERLSPTLLAVARRHLRDAAEAEDVVQRTFLQVHRARFDFRPGAKLRPWVFTIAMNLVRDIHRKRKRHRETPLPAEGRREPAVEPLGFERKEEAALVRRALASLPRDQREAIQLHWIEERPFSEVASIVGASVSAVKVRAHRGYKKMRTWLEAETELGEGALRSTP